MPPIISSKDQSCGALHERVVACDEAATERLVRILLQSVPPQLRRTFTKAPHDFVATAVVDAILEYLRHPPRFDPARGVPLDRFVKYIASRNLLTLLRAEERRRIRETECGQRVEPAIGFDSLADPIDLLRERLLAVTPADEQSALVLWLDGERQTPPIAEALGCASLAPPEQVQEVKRFKDRIRNRARRLRATSGA